MAKLNDKRHQTNGQQLSYSWLGVQAFSNVKNGGLNLVL